VKDPHSAISDAAGPRERLHGAPLATPLDERFDSVCVFCGSSFGREPAYRALAAETGRAIAGAGLRLVYGGGAVGLMGETARAAHEAGGQVLGIIPRFLLGREMLYDAVPHEIVETMHERKARMYAEADAFIVLPGGIGTLEEAIEVLSWARLGLHGKPMAFLAGDGYWDGLVGLFEHIVQQEFAPASLAAQFFGVTTAEQALAELRKRALTAPPALGTERV